MKKMAIIGASYLQEPLIRRAKEMGIETHVFAWAANDVGEKIADFFYPISIVEKEQILQKCQEIEIDGICSIASDLAVITVNYVAHKMGLVGNSLECVEVSTNKHRMRQCFEKNGDPSPRSVQVTCVEDLQGITLKYPVIVKPVDRSGSRGIMKLEDESRLASAIENAKEQGFEKVALVEEFATGQEYSVEFISWKGEHFFLALTHKYTIGSPCYVEAGHLEPAPVGKDIIAKVTQVTKHALDSLGIRNGASHTELKIAKDGSIKIIEIGARMGGDFIGSSLVQLSTGIDFVENVIRIALGEKPDLSGGNGRVAGVRFIFSQEDVEVLEQIRKNNPEMIVQQEVHPISKESVTDSSKRFGYYILCGDEIEQVAKFLPGTLDKEIL